MAERLSATPRTQVASLISDMVERAGSPLHGDADGQPVDLRRADLRGVDLRSLDLSRSLAHRDRGPVCRPRRFGDPELRKQHFKLRLDGADLRGAVLSGAILPGVSLQGARLCGAMLVGADLRGARLRCASLRGTHMSGANLSGADLSHADMRGAAMLTADLAESVLDGADLRDSVLDWATLRDASLQDADLRWSRLVGCDLRDARLDGTNFEGASLLRAELRGAHLSGATSLSFAFLSGAGIEGSGVGRDHLVRGIGESVTNPPVAYTTYRCLSRQLHDSGQTADASWLSGLATAVGMRLIRCQDREAGKACGRWPAVRPGLPTRIGRWIVTDQVSARGR